VASPRHLTVDTDIRNADADPVEAQVTQHAHGRPIGMVQVHFDAVVTTLMAEKVETATQVVHQLPHRCSSRCATPKMKLLDLLLRPQVTTDEVDFMLQTLQKTFDTTVLAGAIASRQLHIQ